MRFDPVLQILKVVHHNVLLTIHLVNDEVYIVQGENVHHCDTLSAALKVAADEAAMIERR